MPSRSAALPWLLRKEWRELIASRAWWILLALTGPLVGVCFISGVRAFAEVSDGAGTGCGIVCAPLIGIWGPTFSAYEVLAVFLLPFVAIRQVAGDRQSGAFKLELQRPLSVVARIGAKVIVLLAAWVVTLAAGILAIALWASYGGSVYAPELGVLLLGHLLNAALTIALAVAVASIADHPATAAIVTLAVTIGTWIVDLAAAVHGSVWATIAGLTPVAMISTFQHGLLRADLVLAALVVTGLGFGLAGVWTRIGTPVAARVRDAAAVVAVTGVLIAASTLVRGNWDASESRQNSFAEPEQEALEHLAQPLAISLHLAPEDPRRVAFTRGPLAKLRRIVPDLRVSYLARTGTGVYEQQDPGYGEITYSYGDRHTTSRIITDEGALEAVFEVANVTAPDENEPPYQGHPLAAEPRGAALAFYGVWPVVVAGVGFRVIRRES